ncbi:MAG: sigma-54-dependent Fis family transcriptional regulator [Ignavibacteriaceae bacterium]|nr:sigma-54-dependent Fis family transcriptional regulator [Ignavibacteriaceae bacterium]
MRTINHLIDHSPIIGHSAALDRVFDLILHAANSQGNVLIQGESGTGKELCAKKIHANSARKNKPFVVINVSAIPENLLESELFGYEAGAFTGAAKAKKGKFELANGGTLFLDEIGDMDFNLQAKILRAIQNREIERLGGTTLIPLDIRIIAATNRELKPLVAEKKFRQDLYYRLNVIDIRLPPLRERKEDIPDLVDYFIQKYALIESKNITHFTDEVLNALLEYDWPGNIRELENVIERAVIMCDSEEITLKLIPAEIVHDARINIYSTDNFFEEVDRFKKNILVKALEKNNFNKAETARQLGINRTYLFSLLKKFKIE